MSNELDLLLNEWKALEAAATPGPWFADGHCLMHDVHYANLDLDYRVSLLNGTDGVSVPGWCEYAADAEFIALSRTIVPRLIAAVGAVLGRARMEQDDAELAMAYAAHINDGLMLASQQARKQAWADAARAIRTALIGDSDE